MVLHLDGIRRFVGLKPASEFWYAVPVGVVAVMAVFYFPWDYSVWRSFVPTQIQALREYLEQGDIGSAERQVHTIKRMAASIGAECPEVAAFEMEKAAKAGNLTAAPTHMPEFEARLGRLNEATAEETG